MATKQISLSPSYVDWQEKSFPTVDCNTFQYRLDEMTLTNIRINYSLKLEPLDVIEQEGVSPWVAATAKISVCKYGGSSSVVKTTKRTSNVSTRGRYSATLSDTIQLSGPFTFSSDDYLEISFQFEENWSWGQNTKVIFEAGPLLTATADIEGLEVKVSPDPVEVGEKVKITINNDLWVSEDLSIKLTANGKTLGTYEYDSDNLFWGSDEIDCDPLWFQTAGATGTKMEVTVQVTDTTDVNVPKTGSKTFFLTREALDVEITAPAITGNSSYINFTFSGRKGHDLYMKIQGAEKGKTNKVTLMAEKNITSSISGERYTINAPDSWFTNINGNEMDVYVTVTDKTWGRVWPSDGKANFALKAGTGANPVIKSVELSSHIYPEQYASVLTDAGYNGFVSGYSQIAIKAKIKAALGAQMNSAVARFNGYDTTLTNKGADPNDTSYYVYEGTTTRVISSTSTVTITITATDKRSRSTVTDAYVNSNEIQQLPNISLRQSTIPTVGSKLNIDPTGYVGSYNCTIKTNNVQVTSTTGETAAYTPDTTYQAYFKNTNQTGRAYISLQVYITDALDRAISGNYVTFRLNAPNPQFLSFTYENIPDSRMPETDKSGNPYGVVSGYSQVKLKATVRWYYNDSTVTVSSGYGATGGTMAKGTGVDNEYGHKDIDYTFETDGVVATSSSNIEFTPTASDAGKDSSRTGETVGAKLSIPVTQLADITISASPSGSVNAGSTITVTPSNYVGDYSYVFATSTKTELAKSEEPLSDETFTQECSIDWFTTAGTESGNLSVELTITDVLGRTNKTPFRFTVRLENLTLQVTPTSLVFGNPVTIAIGGTAGQTITVAFTTKNQDGTIKNLDSFTTTSPNPDPYICPKSWFTGFSTKKQLDITVTASYGSGVNKKEKSLPIKLNYPDLGLAITKTVNSEEVAVTSATVGDNLNYTFSNLEGESVNVNYYYVPQSRSLLQYGPYSEAQTLATPQLFDVANVTKSQSMQVNIVISDARERTATINNFTINASASMRPSVSNSNFGAINPSTVDSSFATNYIGGITRLNATIKASSGSLSKVTEAILSIDGTDVTMTPNGVDSNGKYVFTYVGSSPLQVEAIYEPSPVNLTIGYGLNASGKVVRNSKRAATQSPVSIRKNSTYTVEFKNLNDQYRVQCSLWKGNVLYRIFTSQMHYNELAFDSEDCEKVYISLMRSNESSGTDPVDVEEAGVTIRMINPFDGMVSDLTPISFDVTVKDERGMSSDTTWVGIIFAYPYSVPHASIGYHRCNANGTPNDIGDNCLLTCDFSFEAMWMNTFSPEAQNKGYVTVSTNNYEETKQFDFTKWKKAQFTLDVGYGLNSGGEVETNSLRAATTTPYIVAEHAAYKVTFNGDYIVEYARWEDNTLIKQRTINSSGQYITAEVGESLYISLKRSNETSTSDPVDISEANVQLVQNLGNSEDGSFEFLIPNMSIEQTYQITVTLTDLITSTTYTVKLSTGGAIMDFYRGGKGVAIGKVSEHSMMLEVHPSWELKASVKINGQLYDLSTLLSQIKQQLGI